MKREPITEDSLRDFLKSEATLYARDACGELYVYHDGTMQVLAGRGKDKQKEVYCGSDVAAAVKAFNEL